MKITQKLVRQLMLKCWNRLKRKQKYTSLGIQMLFLKEFYADRFFNIKIKIKKLNYAYGSMIRSKKGNYTLEIDQQERNIIELENTIAHELAHFVEWEDGKKSNHDFSFLHLFLLLSPKSNISIIEPLINHTETYFTKNEKKCYSYNQIVTKNPCFGQFKKRKYYD